MGTNYYRIPTEAEMEKRKADLIAAVIALDVSADSIGRDLAEADEDQFERLSPWDRFLAGTKIHLGKRSGGWRFSWNFHKNRYYSSREELFAFIRSGRVIDEYGAELDTEEFIQMALDWCPNGHIFNQAYLIKHQPGRSALYGPDRFDREIDGLVICSSTEFS